MLLFSIGGVIGTGLFLVRIPYSDV
jgi:hypothetical protein